MNTGKSYIVYACNYIHVRNVGNPFVMFLKCKKCKVYLYLFFS